MACKLEVTVAYLSAVENGKRKVPDKWIAQIADLYELTDEEIESLQRAAYAKRSDLKLNLSDATQDQRELAYSFARRFQSLDSHDIREIQKFLEKGE